MWLRARSLAGERTMVLIQVRRMWILLDGVVAANYLGKSSLNRLVNSCLISWATRPSKAELLQRVKDFQFATEKMW
jgi:hypothetical protein